MKVVENVEHTFETKGFAGTIPIALQFTLILLGEKQVGPDGEESTKYQCAQVIVCDKFNQFNNLVCAMKAGESNITSTVLVNDLTDEAYQQLQLAQQMDEEVQTIEDGMNAEYAQRMAERVLKKVDLKQLVISFNADQMVVGKFMQADPLLAPLIEKRVV